MIFCEGGFLYNVQRKLNEWMREGVLPQAEINMNELARAELSALLSERIGRNVSVNVNFGNIQELIREARSSAGGSCRSRAIIGN